MTFHLDDFKSISFISKGQNIGHLIQRFAYLCRVNEYELERKLNLTLISLFSLFSSENWKSKVSVIFKLPGALEDRHVKLNQLEHSEVREDTALLFCLPTFLASRKLLIPYLTYAGFTFWNHSNFSHSGTHISYDWVFTATVVFLNELSICILTLQLPVDVLLKGGTGLLMMCF